MDVTDQWMDELMDEWMNVIDQWMNGSMDEWMDGCYRSMNE